MLSVTDDTGRVGIARQDFADDERGLVADALRRVAWNEIDSSDQSRRHAGTSLLAEAGRFEVCRKERYYFECPEDGHAFGVPMTCKSRICPECCGDYVRRFYRSIVNQVKAVSARKRRGYTLSLLTLTVTSNRFAGSFPRRRDLKRFEAECRKFLSLYYSKYKGRIAKSGAVYPDRRQARGAGFIGVIEIGTHNNNLHLHALCYGPLVPIRTLRNSWEDITKDSFGVHISRVNSPSHSIRYVTKYIGKPPVQDSMREIAEYALMIKRSRRIRTGGIFYRRVRAEDRERRRPKCPFCGSGLKFTRSPEFAGSGYVPDLSDYRHLEEGETLPYPPWSTLWGRLG